MLGGGVAKGVSGCGVFPHGVSGKSLAARKLHACKSETPSAGVQFHVFYFNFDQRTTDQQVDDDNNN